MKPTILIAGDSWACGEWPEWASLKVIHTGMEEYFRLDGYTVINFARGGCSNKHSVGFLESELNNNSDSRAVVIWVQTDPIRNLKGANYETLCDRAQQAGGLFNLMISLLDEDYNRLNQLAKNHNNKIYAVGGLSCIQTQLLVKYPYIECLVESWPKLLVEHKPDCAIKDWKDFNILDSDWSVDHLKFDQFADRSLKNKCIDEMYLMNSNRVVYKDPIFFPNGTHPNREGHRILFNYIKDNLKL